MTDFTTQSLAELTHTDAFIQRHIGPNATQTQHMLTTLGYDSMDAFVNAIVPTDIRLSAPLDLKASESEVNSLKILASMAEQNVIKHSLIGLGYHDTLIPAVIQRNVLENPGWYTAYTPYQPEIAQGRLESILNFQQMVMDLTGMAIANASLLDEGTAAAEAMAMAKRVVKGNKSNVFFVADNCLPQTLAVMKTRATLLDIEIVVGDIETLTDHDYFGVLFQNPAKDGELIDLTPYIKTVHEAKSIAVVAADIMSLVCVKSPGEMGADIVVGNTQRFGVPMGFGGPHAAYFATQEQYKRSIPGRIIGVSIDSRGNTALRMAMQTREQHIRREKATSNICTAQVLLANLAVFYAIYHGPEGLKRIANRIHRLARILATGLEASGASLKHQQYFDTITLVNCEATRLQALADAAGYNVYKIDETSLSISVNECTTTQDVEALWACLISGTHGYQVDVIDAQIKSKNTLENLARQSVFLTHPVFNSYHSETDMLRYLKKLENKDLSLTHAMISLGSCTMKLNATAEMMPVSWPHINRMHPFAPDAQTKGYQLILKDLEQMLEVITGLDAVSLQPNSGAQGEYAGLLAIRHYLDSIGQQHRNVCLIPRSAHGTNPASAAMAGMRVVVVECDALGNVDQADLLKKAKDVADQLACLMITYPSTHGVYEDGVKEICNIIHQYGGQVYMDGANLNAQVGITSPGAIGADVTHMNLHKTFAIPHGGGGPGMGPIGVRSHLAPFLPKHPLSSGDEIVVNAAPFGSASILTISWMYIRMMGAKGVKQATEYALLNANYIAKKLMGHYEILYVGKNNLVAHECILDLRPLKETSGITEVDIAKRLMDYGFHAPTMSFPVAGTFMVEPTESESQIELDRFINAMISIKAEIDAVASGMMDAEDNPLKHAPHTQKDIATTWERPYSIEQAIFPVKGLYDNKFWPTVNRINDVYGDRNLICACPAIEAYEE